jgi:ribose/xylose/arabinose/galactoside ABC-type transport system permease subunit
MFYMGKNDTIYLVLALVAGWWVLNNTAFGQNLVQQFGNRGGVVLSGAKPGQVGLF